MTQDGFDIEHLAELARINLTDAEKARFAGELSKILAYVRQLQDVDTEGVEETSQVTGLVNVFQAEKSSVANDQSLAELKRQRAEWLAAAPETVDGFIKIPAIFESE